MEKGPEIRGPRVRLRPWRESDADFVLSLVDDPLIPLISGVPDVHDVAGAIDFVKAQQSRFREGKGWAWAIVAGEGDLPVGYVGALWVARGAGRASIGYWIGGAARGRGHAGEAVRTAADWLLTDGEVARLEAYIEPWNAGSVAVAESAGFLREGLMRSFAPIGGTRRDAYLYARIAS